MIHPTTDSEERDMQRLQSALTAALQSNRNGIECLKANHEARALQHFSMAFSKHKKAKSVLASRLLGNGRSIRRTETSIGNNSSSSNNNNAIERCMGDWFVRDLPISGNPEEREEEETRSTEDLLCREPILVPLAIDECVSKIVATIYKRTGQGRFSKELAFRTLLLLSTCHAYNLGLVNHLYGLQILRSTDPSDNTGNPRLHFERAGRLYEFAMRTARFNTKDRNNNNCNRTDPQHVLIVLGCLNNLADLHQKLKCTARGKRCYKQLKGTTERMLATVVLPGRYHQEDTSLLQKHLPVFLKRSREGLSRLRGIHSDSNTSGESEDESSGDEDRNSSSTRAPSPISQYVINSSSAGAA